MQSSSNSPVSSRDAGRAANGHQHESSSSSDLSLVLENNRLWAESVQTAHPGLLEALSLQQRPRFMWIGCSDSRVPSTTITGLLPGDLLVHRNVGNCVVHSDLNLLACLQFAVDVLKVQHIIVCGYYGCGGVQTALTATSLGIADNWIRNIKDEALLHADELSQCASSQARSDRLVELHVTSQLQHVCQTTIVQQAWRRGQTLTVHGLVYAVQSERLKQLVKPSVVGLEQVQPLFRLGQGGDSSE